MIKIPERFKKKLQKSEEWTANVNGVMLNVKDLFITTPFFFPEYTNHGVVHINNILEISNKLIPDSSLENISEKELGILIISLVMHDIGMFISYEGFIRLKNSYDCYMDLYNEKTIEQNWEEYLFNIKNMSEKEMVRMFGTTDISIISIDRERDLDKKTRMVIGEFLRRDHHNIAHEIIKNGLSEIDFLEGTRIDCQTRDLIGLIARSHGMDIRETERYLQCHYKLISKPKNINIFYIMVLLRIADYLDIGEERAPHIIRKFYVKESSVSKREFSWNQCMKHEDFVWDNDRESLFIDAMPTNATQFIDIRKWVTGVQMEIDMSWAIIGEHYDTNALKMTIRRIDSNIMKKEVIDEYEKRFHTQEAHLDANADILKLLIAPLYGDNPSFGVREILQNAVDACREREKKEKDKGEDYSGNILISLDTEQKQIVFIDNGIGMSIDVIKRYYLIAGASYRRSDAWSKSFTENGKIKVIRNGKFGIGVLATFLLGESATVTTRSMDEEVGWEFHIQLDQDNIDIKRVNADIGTKISISITDSVIEALKKEPHWRVCKWNEWYEDDNPKVTYLVNGKEIITYRPAYMEKGYELVQDEYNKFFWSYNNHRFRRHGEVCCNGIIIPDNAYFRGDREYRFHVLMPNLRIEDSEGKLPINLARSELLAVPCQKELYIECCKYVLAKLLTLDIFGGQIEDKFYVNHTYWNFDTGRYIIYSEKGYTLCDAAFLAMAKIKELNVIVTGRTDRSSELLTIDSKAPFIFHKNNGKVSKNIFERILSEDFFDMEYIENSLLNLYIDKKSYMYVKDILQRKKWSYLKKKEGEEGYIISSNDLAQEKSITYSMEKSPLVVEYSVNVKNLSEQDIMLEVLQKYMKQGELIPYDLAERKKKFPEAFCELEQYMEIKDDI